MFGALIDTVDPSLSELWLNMTPLADANVHWSFRGLVVEGLFFQREQTGIICIMDRLRSSIITGRMPPPVACCRNFVSVCSITREREDCDGGSSVRELSEVINTSQTPSYPPSQLSSSNSITERKGLGPGLVQKDLPTEDNFCEARDSHHHDL